MSTTSTSVRRIATAGAAVVALVAGAAFGIAPANAVNQTPNSLPANLSLHGGEYRLSTGGQYELLMQHDGNLVEIGNGRAIWSSKTGGNPGAYFKMQTDGNAVVYTSNGKALWSTKTSVAGNVGGEVAVGTDGYVVVRRTDGTDSWRSPGTGTDSLQGLSTPTLQQTFYLHAGSAKLLMQTDGNLVSYVGSKAVWSSGSAGHPGAFAFVDNNGDFVVEWNNPSHTILWRTHTNGAGSDLKLQLHTDGSLVLLRGSTVVWRS